MYRDENWNIIIEPDELAAAVEVGRELGLSDAQLERMPTLLREHAADLSALARSVRPRAL
jgi:hypothetical protein